MARGHSHAEGPQFPCQTERSKPFEDSAEECGTGLKRAPTLPVAHAMI